MRSTWKSGMDLFSVVFLNVLFIPFIFFSFVFNFLSSMKEYNFLLFAM